MLPTQGPGHPSLPPVLGRGLAMPPDEGPRGRRHFSLLRATSLRSQSQRERRAPSGLRGGSLDKRGNNGSFLFSDDLGEERRSHTPSNFGGSVGSRSESRKSRGFLPFWSSLPLSAAGVGANDARAAPRGGREGPPASEWQRGPGCSAAPSVLHRGAERGAAEDGEPQGGEGTSVVRAGGALAFPWARLGCHDGPAGATIWSNLIGQRIQGEDETTPFMPTALPLSFAVMALLL